MILGDVCTRGCRSCGVKTATGKRTNGWPSLGADEPPLVVITSVDRDDLDDGGAGIFAETIRETRRRCPDLIIEALIPDFRGDLHALRKVVDAAPQVIGQNIETVRRLTRYARDRRCGYEQTLEVLANIKALDPRIYTKSAILLGLGETADEVLATMRDLRAHNVDILTLGQYLQPTRKHVPVAEFLHPDRFSEYEEQGMKLGFRYIAAGPMVRSSYKAAEFFVESMLTSPQLGGNGADPDAGR